jgi:hypothetical protein
MGRKPPLSSRKRSTLNSRSADEDLAFLAILKSTGQEAALANRTDKEPEEELKEYHASMPPTLAPNEGTLNEPIVEQDLNPEDEQELQPPQPKKSGRGIY